MMKSHSSKILYNKIKDLIPSYLLYRILKKFQHKKAMRSKNNRGEVNNMLQLVNLLQSNLIHPKMLKKQRGKGEKVVSEEAPSFRIFFKNKGISERIAKLQGKKFKFDEVGIGSTAEKAFDVE
nr:hypothetical protein [Tanacetum cinerariifolium]